MKHLLALEPEQLKEPERLAQPAFQAETETDVYELEWLARDILHNEELRQQIKTHRKCIVDNPDTKTVLYFQGEEAQLILDEFRKVGTNRKLKTTARGKIAIEMTKRYDATRRQNEQSLAIAA